MRESCSLSPELFSLASCSKHLILSNYLFVSSIYVILFLLCLRGFQYISTFHRPIFLGHLGPNGQFFSNLSSRFLEEAPTSLRICLFVLTVDLASID